MLQNGFNMSQTQRLIDKGRLICGGSVVSEKICKNAKFEVARIDEIEKTTKHDVIAFLTSVSESLGDESRFVHYGMTSSDCIDTAVALQMKESLELIISDVEEFMQAVKKQSERAQAHAHGRQKPRHPRRADNFWPRACHLV